MTYTRIDAATLSELLSGENVAAELRAAWGDIAYSVPELGALAMDEGGVSRLHKDNVAHTIAVTAKTPDRLRVRLTGLFHDVGKPPTRRIEDGVVTFHNHEAVGGKMTRSVLARLGYEPALVHDVSRLVRLSGATKGSLGWGDAAVRRLAREAGDLLGDLLDFAAVDVTSRHAHKHEAVAHEISTLRWRLAEVAESDARAAWRPALSGEDIMALYGLAPGREVGRLMRALSDASREDETWSYERAVAWLTNWRAANS